jgi:hypothetical protein
MPKIRSLSKTWTRHLKCRVFTSMPSMCRNIDVPRFEPFAGKLRTGTAALEFVAAPVRQRNRRTPMAARSAGRSVSRLATRKCVSKWTEFENYGGQTVPCYQFQGRQRRDPN